jgi:hypothetical protein
VWCARHVRRRAAVAEEAGVEATSMAVEETDDEKTDGTYSFGMKAKKHERRATIYKLKNIRNEY